VYAVIEVQGIESPIFLKGTISERADDIPLIIHWLKQMEIASIIDQELPAAHGNRKGLSYGQLSVLFLSYVVIQSDHRLCAVENWVEKHRLRLTLEMSTGKSILKRYRVQEQILTSIEKKISYQKVYQGAGRGSKNRPFRRVRQTTLALTYQRCETTITHQEAIAGWRLYVTNATTERLTLEQAVNSYREQWQPERGFHRFKRGRLPALPIYFQDESRIRGLMFLLTIALTLFTLMEFVVRRQLTESEQSISGLYSGNPKRQTARPTAEQLLTAFSDLTLYLYPDGSTEISSLNSLQRQILNLMKIPESIYLVPQLVPN